MDENYSNDILITKYLAPEWRQVAIHPDGYLPVGYIDALIDAAQRMAEEAPKKTKKR